MNTNENKLLSCLYIVLFYRIVANGHSCVDPKDVTFLAPVTRPDKVVCVGLNYSGHCEEQNIPQPKEPMFFSKFSSTIVGPFDNVVIPPITNVIFNFINLKLRIFTYFLVLCT